MGYIHELMGSYRNFKVQIIDLFLYIINTSTVLEQIDKEIKEKNVTPEKASEVVNHRLSTYMMDRIKNRVTSIAYAMGRYDLQSMSEHLDNPVTFRAFADCIKEEDTQLIKEIFRDSIEDIKRYKDTMVNKDMPQGFDNSWRRYRPTKSQNIVITVDHIERIAQQLCNTFSLHFEFIRVDDEGGLMCSVILKSKTIKDRFNEGKIFIITTNRIELPTNMAEDWITETYEEWCIDILGILKKEGVLHYNYLDKYAGKHVFVGTTEGVFTGLLSIADGRYKIDNYLENGVIEIQGDLLSLTELTKDGYDKVVKGNLNSKIKNNNEIDRLRDSVKRVTDTFQKGQYLFCGSPQTRQGHDSMLMAEALESFSIPSQMFETWEDDDED